MSKVKSKKRNKKDMNMEDGGKEKDKILPIEETRSSPIYIPERNSNEDFLSYLPTYISDWRDCGGLTVRGKDGDDIKDFILDLVYNLNNLQQIRSTMHMKSGYVHVATEPRGDNTSPNFWWVNRDFNDTIGSICMCSFVNKDGRSLTEYGDIHIEHHFICKVITLLSDELRYIQNGQIYQTGYQTEYHKELFRFVRRYPKDPSQDQAPVLPLKQLQELWENNHTSYPKGGAEWRRMMDVLYSRY